jgi:hypothetical protein
MTSAVVGNAEIRSLCANSDGGGVAALKLCQRVKHQSADGSRREILQRGLAICSHGILVLELGAP